MSFWVLGLGLGMWGYWCEALGFEVGVTGVELQVLELGFRVCGFRF